MFNTKIYIHITGNCISRNGQGKSLTIPYFGDLRGACDFCRISAVITL